MCYNFRVVCRRIGILEVNMKKFKIIGIIAAILLVALIVVLVIENVGGFLESGDTTSDDSGDVTTGADETTLGGFVETEEVTMIEIPVDD